MQILLRSRRVAEVECLSLKESESGLVSTNIEQS